MQQEQKSAKEQEEAKQQAAKKQHNCEEARKRVASFERPRVNMVGQNGEQRRATEEERVAELAKARDMVEKYCK